MSYRKKVSFILSEYAQTGPASQSSRFLWRASFRLCYKCTLTAVVFLLLFVNVSLCVYIHTDTYITYCMYVHIFVHGYIHIYIHTSLNSGIQFYVFLVFFYFFRSAAAAALLPPLGVSCLFALKLLTKHQKKEERKTLNFFH